MNIGNRRWSCVSVVMLMLVVSIGASSVFAEESSSRMDGALRKLGRGITNVATCPGEVLRMTERVGQRDGYLAAMSVGLLQGIWRTITRGTVGVFEIATFYAEIPKNFEPIIRPEFVWAHGDWQE